MASIWPSPPSPPPTSVADEGKEPHCPFCSLPAELSLGILKHLSVSDLRRASTACPSLHSILTSTISGVPVWRGILERSGMLAWYVGVATGVPPFDNTMPWSVTTISELSSKLDVEVSSVLASEIGHGWLQGVLDDSATTLSRSSRSSSPIPVRSNRVTTPVMSGKSVSGRRLRNRRPAPSPPPAPKRDSFSQHHHHHHHDHPGQGPPIGIVSNPPAQLSTSPPTHALSPVPTGRSRVRGNLNRSTSMSSASSVSPANSRSSSVSSSSNPPTGARPSSAVTPRTGDSSVSNPPTPPPTPQPPPKNFWRALAIDSWVWTHSVSWSVPLPAPMFPDQSPPASPRNPHLASGTSSSSSSASSSSRQPYSPVHDLGFGPLRVGWMQADRAVGFHRPYRPASRLHPLKLRQWIPATGPEGRPVIQDDSIPALHATFEPIRDFRLVLTASSKIGFASLTRGLLTILPKSVTHRTLKHLVEDRPSASLSAATAAEWFTQPVHWANNAAMPVSDGGFLLNVHATASWVYVLEGDFSDEFPQYFRVPTSSYTLEWRRFARLMHCDSGMPPPGAFPAATMVDGRPVLPPAFGLKT